MISKIGEENTNTNIFYSKNLNNKSNLKILYVETIMIEMLCHI